MLTFPIREKDNRFRVDCEQDFRLCAKGFHTPHPSPLPVEGRGNLTPVAIIAVVALFLRQEGEGDGSEDAEEGGEMIPAIRRFLSPARLGQERSFPAGPFPNRVAQGIRGL